MGSFTVQSEPLRRSPDCPRIEVRAFEQNRSGLIPDFGIQPTHHSGERNWHITIANQQILGNELTLDTIEGREFLDLIRGPYIYFSARQPLEVEGMQRLPGFYHHVIGNIDDVIDG